MTQNEALSILKTGVNVFLTGEPGSGKTHTVNSYIAYLRARGIDPAITASTGIAATHIGGMTIHSWSGIGIKKKLDKHDLSKIMSNRRVADRVRRVKVLIIDEISMLSPQTLSMVDVVCRSVRGGDNPFGGLQVVLVGDFFQLPPVVKNDPDENGQAMLIGETPKRFAYDAPVWDKADFSVCYLTEQYRQDDSGFLSILSAIRRNEFDDKHIPHIEKRKISESLAPGGVPKLFSHNVDVDRVNTEMLAELPHDPKEFIMSSEGSETLVANLIRGCLSPETLLLKVGASVMFTKNNSKTGFVNGTLGEVESFNEDNGRPIVRTRDGWKIEVPPTDWAVEENGRVIARITQLPLRLAWAITVHKSQGMSMDAAFMDLSEVFEFGQGYVALSRLKRLAGLHISGWNERAFQVHPEVLEKDKEFRIASDESLKKFSMIPQIGLLELQSDFITACGGQNIAEEALATNANKIKSVNGFDEIRKTHPNAYRKWDEAQDNELRELFRKDAPIKEMAERFGRNGGAIRSRLVKLGLISL